MSYPSRASIERRPWFPRPERACCAKAAVRRADRAGAEDNQEGRGRRSSRRCTRCGPTGPARRASLLSFTPKAASPTKSHLADDRDFVFDAEASRWVRRPSINSSPALASGASPRAVKRQALRHWRRRQPRGPSSAVRRLDSPRRVDCAPLNRPTLRSVRVRGAERPGGARRCFGGGERAGRRGSGGWTTGRPRRAVPWTNGPNLVFFGHEGDVLTAAIGDDVYRPGGALRWN